MAATPLQGVLYANVQNERFISVLVSGAGDALSTGFSTGLRTLAKVNRKAITEKDVLDRDIPQKTRVDVELDLLQTDIPALSNAYLLGKSTTGFVNAALKTEQATWFNFVKNTGAVGSAAGTALLGVDWEFMIDDKTRKLNLKMGSNMENEEWQYLLANVGSMKTGGAGANITPALATSGYDRTKHFSPGFKSITIDAVNVGVFNSPKLTIKSKAHSKDDRERPLNTHVDVTAEFTMLQTTASDLLGITTTGEQLEKAIVFTDYAGNTFTFAAGSVGVSSDTEIADKKGTTKVTLSGSFVNNVDEATPNCIDIGVASATDVKFTKIGY